VDKKQGSWLDTASERTGGRYFLTVKELLPVENAKTVEMPFTDPPSEDDESGVNREKFGT
jgi:hypothetical protein